jgi:tetratricopeptide (TPR) repeat protein
MVISEVFRDPVSDPPPPGPVMLLEGLRSRVAGQLAVLDDVELTGTGQSSAEVLGVVGSVVADRLTGHLVREIIVRGFGGGPLTPLADQLNHELTRLQGQRIEGMLARLAGEVRDALARPGDHVTMPGRPLEEVTNPFILEVHQPVQPEDAPPGLPLLPPYVPREHDEVLAQVVRAAAGGRSTIAVLVGGSSTGKTRACWEAIAVLRGQNPSWRLWHPIDPSRPDAALAELAGVGPRTVVWLNEAQFYLDPTEAGLGEQVAAGLRELLRDPGRAPVLVLATLWPRFWDTLTTRPADGDDRHAQARELLAEQYITVPAAFTPAQMRQLDRVADPRMVLAARSAPDGEVIQFLAGAPILLARYRNATPAAKALIHAAMDARRLGMGAVLPQAFLEAAAPGYLTDSEWDTLGEDWLEQALAYTAVPCKGARGPLTRIRSRPDRHVRNNGDQSGNMATTAGALYRLADYLDQYGRHTRGSQLPPAEFWHAACHASLPDLNALASNAERRGLLRDAARLYKLATSRGSTNAAVSLIRELKSISPGDRSATQWVAEHASVYDATAVTTLLQTLWKIRANDQAAVLAKRVGTGTAIHDLNTVSGLNFYLMINGERHAAIALAKRAAPEAPLNDAFPVSRLLTTLWAGGARAEVAMLLARNPAAQAPLRDDLGCFRLLEVLQKIGANEQLTTLLARNPAAYATPKFDNTHAYAEWFAFLVRSDAMDQQTALANRLATYVTIHNPYIAGSLIKYLLAWKEAYAEATKLASRIAAEIRLDNPRALASLLTELRKIGADEQVAILLQRRPAAHTALQDMHGVVDLLASLREAGADEQFAMLLARNPAAHAAPDSLIGGWSFIDWSFITVLRDLGAREQADAFLKRAISDIPINDPHTVARILGYLLEIRADGEITALVTRRPAAHAAIDSPVGVSNLLKALYQVGARNEVSALASRAAAQTPLDSMGGVAMLLNALIEINAEDQAAVLLARDPALNAHFTDYESLGLNVSELVKALIRAGSRDQAATLADRAAKRAPIRGFEHSMKQALATLRGAGLDKQSTIIANRLPAEGFFDVFRSEGRNWSLYKFGREIDGTPAAPWGWEDLG